MRHSRFYRLSITARVWIAAFAGLGMFYVTEAGAQTPTITGLDPASTMAGGPGLTLTVNGTNFAADSVVRWNGFSRTTSFVNSTQLTTSIPASDIAASGTATIVVFNPSDSSASDGKPFEVSAPVPSISGLLPNSRPAGGTAFTLTVSGANFILNSVVRWNGADRPTSFFSKITLEAAIPVSDLETAGTAEVTVFNPPPGGGTSSVLSFAVTTANPPPGITSVNPTSAIAGSSGFTLTVRGTNFTLTSVVLWNGESRPTQFVNSTTLTANIPASDLALPGAVSITVKETAPGGGTSEAVTFAIEVFFTEYFGHLAVGGGYSTEFTLTNPSGTAVTGNLFLTDTAGTPLVVNLSDPEIAPQSGSPDHRIDLPSSSFSIVLPPGGTKVVSASALSPGELTRTGWARFESADGPVSGVATFLYREGNVLKTIAGVLASPPVEFATIPVDNDDRRSRFMGFAVANRSDENTNIRIVTVNENGAILDTISPSELNPLGPRKQVARFLHQYISQAQSLRFKGSMVLVVEGGKKCVIVALVEQEGLLTAIPVIQEKAPNVPN